MKRDGASAGTRMLYIAALSANEKDGKYINRNVHGMKPKIKSRSQRYFNTQATTAQPADGQSPQAAEFQRDTQAAPGVMMTLVESATYTNEIEMQAEELMQSLTVVLDDGYGAKVGCQASQALLVKTLAVQREHERAVYRHRRPA